MTKTDDIDVLVNHWISIFSLTIDKHAPICEMRVSEKYYRWIDKELKELMRTRDKLKKSAVKFKSSLIMDSYRQVRNKVNSLNVILTKYQHARATLENLGKLSMNFSIRGLSK